MVSGMIGETLGSYRLVGRLGEGRMGEVYLAEHARIARRAAIKFCCPSSARRPRWSARFFAEAARALIGHPGIVQVLDCDVIATGAPTS